MMKFNFIHQPKKQWLKIKGSEKNNATHNKPSFFIITGGPGADKTTLLNALEARQYNIVAEIARQLIKEQMDTGGDALPSGNTT